MTNTQGVIEACYTMLMELKTEANQSDLYMYGMPIIEYVKQLRESNQRHHEDLKKALQAADSDTMPAGVLLALQLGVSINDHIKRPGVVDSMMRRPAVFRPLMPKDLQKLSGMNTEAFAKHLYNICTDNGTRIIPEDDEGKPCPILLERCLYAAYVYTQVTEYLDKQNAAFLPVPMPKGIMQLPWINTGIIDIDEFTKQGTITVGDTIFTVRKDEISTGALMLALYLLHTARITNQESLAIPLREYAEIKKRSTGKQALQKLKAEVADQMNELAPLGFNAIFKMQGKNKSAGHILLNGGTHTVVNGVIYWNFNHDLFQRLWDYAPADIPRELFAVNPQTNANSFYFGMYIAQNWRLNEDDMPARSKIPIRTLIERSPKLPKYESVRASNGNVSARIIRKTFIDLDALDNLKYDFYTADNKRIDNTYNLNYKTFINGYIKVNYDEYPQHKERIEESNKHEQKTKNAKEKAQLTATAKASAEKKQ